MNEQFPKRVRAAAVAGWWTVLIAVIYLLVAWAAWLAIMHAQPSWLLTLWGGGELTFSAVHTISLWFFAVFKMVLLTAILIVVWLTLWARRLTRAQTQ